MKILRCLLVFCILFSIIICGIMNIINYISISMILFMISALLFTFSDFKLNTTDIPSVNESGASGGFYVTKRGLAFVVVAVLVSWIAIFALGLYYGADISKSQTVTQTQTVNVTTIQSEKEKVDINHASKSELMTLGGIGETKAELIINNRPYQDVYDLLNKNIIGDNVFYKIKDVIKIVE